MTLSPARAAKIAHARLTVLGRIGFPSGWLNTKSSSVAGIPWIILSSVVLPKYRYFANDAGSTLFSQSSTAEAILSKVRRANELLETLH